MDSEPIELDIPPAKDMYLKLKAYYDADLEKRRAEEYRIITEKAALCAYDIIAKMSTRIQHRFIIDVEQFVVEFDTSSCLCGHYTIDGSSMNLAIATRLNKEFTMRGYEVNQSGTSICIAVPKPDVEPSDV